MAVETTLVLVKPDGVRRGLSGEIVARFERRGLGDPAIRIDPDARPVLGEDEVARCVGEACLGAVRLD